MKSDKPLATSSSLPDPGMLETSLLELIEKYSCSVRLRNCITWNFWKKEFPYKTILEYIKAGSSAKNKFLYIKNSGRKTAHELDLLVNKFISENDLYIEDNTIDPTSLDDEILSKSLRDLLSEVPCSVRLENCLISNFEDEDFPFRTVAEYLRLGSSAKEMILQYKNSGKKSALELDEIVHKYLLSQDEHNEPDTFKPKYISELIVLLMEELKPKESEVLSLRYGFSGKNKETLEEVGQRFGVTRERIRQLEVKAIKKLSLEVFKQQIIELLDDNAERIYISISDRFGVVRERDLLAIRKSILPGEHLLLMEIANGSLGEWLNSIADKITDGWYHGRVDRESVERCIDEFTLAAKELSLPTLLRTLKNQINVEDEIFDAALSSKSDWTQYKGLVLDKPVGSRKKRLARLFELLYDNPQSLVRLVDIYNLTYPEEMCTFRDAVIVMSDAPQLFISLGGEAWATVGYLEESDLLEFENRNYPTDNFDDSDTPSSEQDDEGSHNLVGFIRQLLKETGPIHFVQLRDLLTQRSNGRYAPGGLGPMLLYTDDFVRLAPGVYGLKGCEGEIDFDLLKPSVLLRSQDCNNYVISRWAGEAVDSYPLWSYAMEYEWCRWARTQASSELFSSLLAICEPDSWMVAHEEKTYWKNLKSTKGFYRLDGASRHPLYDKPPTLRDLYCLFVDMESLPNLNWIRVNRILGRRNNNNHAAAVLAILIALGIVSPAESWQLPHSIAIYNTNYKVLKNELSKSLAVSGKLAWTSSVGLRFLKRLQEATLSGDLGWVDSDQFQHLIQELSEGREFNVPGSNLEGDAPNDEPESPLEQLLKENRQKKLNTDFSSVVKSLLQTT